MDEAIETILYQRNQLKAKDDYIRSLETIAISLGSALTVCAAMLFYLYIM